AGCHGIFELRERQAGVLFSDQLALHVFELPKFTKRLTELVTPLDRWLYFLRHGAELDPGRLPVELRAPEMARAVGELQMISQSALERERYEARLKVQRDLSS